MSEVKRFDIEGSEWELIEGRDWVTSEDFDRVTAELASANSDKEAYAQNAIDLRKRVDALQALLTAADERRDYLEGLMQMFIENSDDKDVVELCRHALKPAEGVDANYGADIDSAAGDPQYGVSAIFGPGFEPSSYGTCDKGYGVPYETAAKPVTFVSRSDHECPKKAYSSIQVFWGVQIACGTTIDGAVFYCEDCKPVEAAKCERCGVGTVESCGDGGCGFLGAGNGAPE